MRPETRVAYDGRIRVESVVLGNFDASVMAATRLAAPVDVLWVTPKAYGLRESLAAAGRDALGHGLVVPLLNGIEHIDLLRQVYPPEQVVAGTLRVESERLAPGRVVQRTPFIQLGLAASGPVAIRVRQLAAEVAATGITVRVVEDEKAMLWEKLAFLAPSALATSALGQPLGAVRADAVVRE